MNRESDEHLDAVLIGGGEVHPIVSIEYDSAWPSRFEALGLVIKEAIGDVVLSVAHSGSTAVPGLAAKPIIDIRVTVDDVANEDSYVSKLESVGFVVRVRELGHRMMRTPRPISEDEKESCSARVD